MAHAKTGEPSRLPYPVEATIPAGPSDDDGTENTYQRRYGPEITPSTFAGKRDSNPFTYLEHFHTMFLIDDSTSMVEHWGEVGQLLEKIGPVCTEHDADGINVQFLNHRPRGHLMSGGAKTGYWNIGLARVPPGTPADMPDSVEGIYHRVKPKGRCRLGRGLASVLDHYVYEYEWEHRLRRREIAPLNLIVVTAGIAEDNPFETILRTAKTLDKYGAPAYQVGIQFFLVGKDKSARRALEYADDELGKKHGARDIVDTVTWSGLPGDPPPDAVVKVVLGAVKRSIDNMAV
ncbi:hypothetical protein F4778DRAFT_58739 [Xylariomycetidae sp. FL2044]|nr:hypothetical protein F4778DRAFT_58739 [Xylariomycetidae sp. FL2044]